MVANVKSSHELFRTYRQHQNRQDRERCDATPLAERIKAVVLALLTVDHTPCKQLGRVSPSVDRALPRINLEVGNVPDWEIRKLLDKAIRQDNVDAIAEVEEAVRIHRGFNRFETNTTGDERDKRLLTQFVGYDARDVWKISPSLGQPALIRRVRQENGYDPQNGQPLAAARM